MIKYVVECEQAYEMISMIITAIIRYLIVKFVTPYIYKLCCKVINAIKTYRTVHTKVDVKDVSIETDLHQ